MADDTTDEKATDKKASETEATEDKAAEDRAAEESTNDDSSEQASSDEASSEENATDEDSTNDDAAGDDSADDAADDTTTDDTATDDKASDDKASDDKASDDKASDDKASDDKASDDKASDDKASDDAGLKVHDSAGDGRPVVLIHGWPLSSESWSEQTTALKDAGYRVVSYDRRGFGESDPGDKYDYDILAGDLDNVLSDLELEDVTLVGFSMGGGEVARYVSKYGEDKVHSVVFAAAVPPYLAQDDDDNPDGPLTEDAAKEMRTSLEEDRDAFFDDFTTNFFSAGDDLKVSEDQRQAALAVCRRSDERAALECMDAWAGTDFRDDLTKISVPTLVIHGDADGIVPFEGSGKRTHEAVEGSELVVLDGAPHGCNVSHAQDFNKALLEFLEK